MPAVLTYPGVYIEEVPSGVRTISGVATSIAAFVGRTKRGPVNEAVTINSFGDFERIFGGVWLDSPLSFAVQDFFLNGGGQAIVVRLFNDPAEKTARTKARAAAKAVTDAATTASTPATASGDDVASGAHTGIPAGTDPAEQAAGNKVFDAAKKAADDGGDKAAVLKAALQAVDDAIDAGIDAALKKAAETEPPRARIILATSDAHKKLVLQAASPGSWGKDLRVRVDNKDVEDPGEFNLTIYDGEAETTEAFRGLSLNESDFARYVGNVLDRRSELVRLEGAAPDIPPTPHKEAKSGDKIWENDDFSSKVSAGGLDGDPLTQDDFTPDRGQVRKRGLYALEVVDLFNLLCIPPHKLQEDPNVDQGTIEQGLIAAAIRYCEDRRAIFLIDPPAAWSTKAAAVKGVDTDVGEPSKNAAVYFPAILRPNPKRNYRTEPFAPCGAVAGVIARTDTQRGIWKAPAGLEATLFNAPGFTVPLTDAENGELNPKGVNCLRSMPGSGRVVWGARTRLGSDRNASEWKYLPVRRTALYIEESLYRGTQWVVFEPNDEPLWASIRLNVGAFMNGMFRQGAFQGGSPRDAYFVKCDKDTTTQNDIDKGVVNILVGFAPLKPAEFVVIRLQQMAGQIQT